MIQVSGKKRWEKEDASYFSKNPYSWMLTFAFLKDNRYFINMHLVINVVVQNLIMKLNYNGSQRNKVLKNK